MKLRDAEVWLGKVEYTGLLWLMARYLGLRDRVASVDGLRMPYFERQGTGDPIVLVHGFGADKESWLLMVWALCGAGAFGGLGRWSGRAPGRGYRLLIPDLPGHGGASVINRGRATAKAQAEALSGFLDLLAVERCHLVGNSMGGGISLRLARDRPERVGSMVLIDSAGPKVDPSPLDLALERGENPLIPTSIEHAESMMEMVAEKPTRLPRAMLRHIIDQRVRVADRLEEIFSGWHRGAGDQGIPQDLERISVPTLVIHGECDRVIDASTGRSLARRLQHGKLLLLPGVGHIPQVEDPITTARAVADFVAGH